MLKYMPFAAMAVLIAACGRDVPPAMSPAAALPSPGAGQASVVFVRPSTACDTSEYSIVVDEGGHFVGNVAPGTQTAVPVTPGVHVYYSWSNVDLRSEKDPAFNPVAATRVNALASETQYVALVVQMRGDSGVTRCNSRSFVSMQRVAPHQEAWEDLQESLHGAQPLVPDQGAGQLALNTNPALLQTHLELGQSKLRAMDNYWAHKTRRDAERAAGAE